MTEQEDSLVEERPRAKGIDPGLAKRLVRREVLLQRGTQRVKDFCTANDLPIPDIVPVSRESWVEDVCAYYRPQVIRICLTKCADECDERVGRNWNWPGNTTDRTPYGVLCHELGHHCDILKSYAKGEYFGDYSIELRKASREDKLTRYCPNDAEWFAEMFRLYVTNSELLALLRPRTWVRLSRDFKSVSNPDWREELGKDVPEKVVENLEHKLKMLGVYGKEKVRRYGRS